MIKETNIMFYDEYYENIKRIRELTKVPIKELNIYFNSIGIYQFKYIDSEVVKMEYMCRGLKKTFKVIYESYD